jgi:hypothetical protein
MRVADGNLGLQVNRYIAILAVLGLEVRQVVPREQVWSLAV